MIKYIGLTLIMTASVLIGLNLSGSLSKRVQVLMDFRSVLWSLKLDISYSMPEIKELLLKNMNPAFLTTAEDIIKGLEQGQTLTESSERVINTSPLFDVLKEEERKSVSSILSFVGSTDADGQLNMLDNAVEKMDHYIKNALDDKQRNSKIYLTTSIYCGALAVIILL